MPEDEPLACRILRALATETEGGAGMSLPRLGKQLGQSASVLMRELAYLGEATLAGQPGPGWVRVAQSHGRWTVYITAEGRAVARALAEHKAANAVSALEVEKPA